MKRPALAALGAVLLLGISGCLSSNARPGFTPMPEARSADVELDPIEATKLLAENLQDAGIPVTKIAPQDGYFETAWFDTASKQPASAASLGAEVVRIRGWATPSRHGWSTVTVETVYRAVADPSLPERELERSVPYAHPTRQLVRESFADVGITTNPSEIGAPEAVAVKPPTMDPGAVPRPGVQVERPESRVARDTVAPDALPAARDTTPAQDTVPALRDTTPVRDTLPKTPILDAAPDTLPKTPILDAAPAPAPPPRDTPTLTEGFSVQVAAETDSATAVQTSARLARIGFNPRIVREDGYWKVRTQLWNARPFAEAQLDEIRKTFGDAFVVRE